MSFREKMAAQKKDLQKRHTDVEKEGQKKYGSIFNMEKVPKGVGFWRPGLGEHELDIIPYVVGSQHPNKNLIPDESIHFVLRLFVYMRVGSNEDPYVSLYDNYSLPDPVKEWMAQQGRLPKDLYKKTASKERCIFYIWCHDNPEEEAKGLQIWEESAFNSFEKIQEQATLPKGGGHIPFSDWDNGYRLFFNVSEESYEDDKGAMQKGKKFGAFQFHPRPEKEKQIPDALLDLAMGHPLDECIIIPTYASLYEAHHGKKPPKELVSEVETSSEQPSRLPPKRETNVDTPARSSDDGDATGVEDTTQDTSTDDTPQEEEQDQSAIVVEGECPVGDFGHAEDYAECNGCPLWDACMDYEKQQNSGGSETQEDTPAEEETPTAEETPTPERKAPPTRKPPVKKENTTEGTPGASQRRPPRRPPRRTA